MVDLDLCADQGRIFPSPSLAVTAPASGKKKHMLASPGMSETSIKVRVRYLNHCGNLCSPQPHNIADLTSDTAAAENGCGSYSQSDQICSIYALVIIHLPLVSCTDPRCYLAEMVLPLRSSNSSNATSTGNGIVDSKFTILGSVRSMPENSTIHEERSP